MGHANISITLDRYEDLMPGFWESEAAGLLDAYLAAQRRRDEEVARAAGGVQDLCLTGAPTGARVAHDRQNPL